MASFIKVLRTGGMLIASGRKTAESRQSQRTGTSANPAHGNGCARPAESTGDRRLTIGPALAGRAALRRTAGTAATGAVGQCDKSTGTVIRASSRRVTPPSRNSDTREWP
jgi:hypothetical protein